MLITHYEFTFTALECVNNIVLIMILFAGDYGFDLINCVYYANCVFKSILNWNATYVIFFITILCTFIFYYIIITFWAWLHPHEFCVFHKYHGDQVGIVVFPYLYFQRNLLFNSAYWFIYLFLKSPKICGFFPKKEVYHPNIA